MNARDRIEEWAKKALEVPFGSVLAGLGFLAAIVPAATIAIFLRLFVTGSEGAPLDSFHAGVELSAILVGFGVWWVSNRFAAIREDLAYAERDAAEDRLREAEDSATTWHRGCVQAIDEAKAWRVILFLTMTSEERRRILECVLEMVDEMLLPDADMDGPEAMSALMELKRSGAVVIVNRTHRLSRFGRHLLALLRGNMPVAPMSDRDAAPVIGYLGEIEENDDLDDLQKWRAFMDAWGIRRRRCSDMREDLHRRLSGGSQGM